MAKSNNLRAGANRIKSERKMAKTKPGLWTRICTWVRSLDCVVLTNTALLVAIIVLFSFLILDITKCVRCHTDTKKSAENVTETNGIYLGARNNRNRITLPLPEKLTPKWKTVEPIV